MLWGVFFLKMISIPLSQTHRRNLHRENDQDQNQDLWHSAVLQVFVTSLSFSWALLTKDRSQCCYRLLWIDHKNSSLCYVDAGGPDIYERCHTLSSVSFEARWFICVGAQWAETKPQKWIHLDFSPPCFLICLGTSAYLFIMIQTTSAPCVNCLSETMNNQDKELEVIWPLGTMSQVNCIFQKKTMEDFCLHRNSWKHVCGGRWTFHRIYCWWWWWSQSSSQLAGSTASFGNWESLTGKERQQLYIQMDAGSQGPDVFLSK